MKFKVLFISLVSTLLLTACFNISADTLTCTMTAEEADGVTVDIMYKLSFENDRAVYYEAETIMSTESEEEAVMMKEMFEQFMLEEDDVIIYGFEVDGTDFILTMEADVDEMLAEDEDNPDFNLVDEEVNLRLTKDEIQQNLENNGWSCR